METHVRTHEKPPQKRVKLKTKQRGGGKKDTWTDTWTPSPEIQQPIRVKKKQLTGPALTWYWTDSRFWSIAHPGSISDFSSQNIKKGEYCIRTLESDASFIQYSLFLYTLVVFWLLGIQYASREAVSLSTCKEITKEKTIPNLHFWNTALTRQQGWPCL